LLIATAAVWEAAGKTREEVRAGREIPQECLHRGARRVLVESHDVAAIVDARGLAVAQSFKRLWKDVEQAVPGQVPIALEIASHKPQQSFLIFVPSGAHSLTK
jgi:hypothetical protein